MLEAFLIHREITDTLLAAAAKFPVVSVTGPRQSGKTTFVRAAFPNHEYLSLEDPATRSLAEDDPRAFFRIHSGRLVLDEVQRAPELFSYLQGIVDESGEAGRFVLSGSQNFLLSRSISQSLAGRVSVQRLLPLSLSELEGAGVAAPVDDLVVRGGYPRIYDKGIDPLEYFPSYIETYLERDVRAEGSVGRLAAFRRFIRLCALRCSELLNMTSLASDVGVAVKTAGSWLSVLEASYLAFRLEPFYANLGKRLTRSPKLYFFDSGLASHLCGIDSGDALALGPRRGALFECMVVCELVKGAYARGLRPSLSFYRDSNGREIDVLVERGGRVVWAIEVKSSSTYSPKWFKNLDAVGGLLGVDEGHRLVACGLDEGFETKHGRVVPVSSLPALVYG